MAMPLPNEIDPPEHLSTESLGAEEFDRRLAMTGAFNLWQEAHERDEAGSLNTYVMHAPLDAPIDEAVAILLTRDGNTPQFEEKKEHLIVVFPFLDGQIPSDIPPIIWLEHVDKRGRSYKYSLTADGILPYEESVATPVWHDVLRVTKEPARRVRDWRANPAKLAKRYRELIQNFYLTPQKRNPFARQPDRG